MGPEFVALIYLAIGCWVLAAILALVNLIILANIKISQRLKKTHGVVFLVYLGFAIALFAGGFNQNFFTVAIAVFGIPIMVASHFVYLLCLRRRVRVQDKDERSDMC